MPEPQFKTDSVITVETATVIKNRAIATAGKKRVSGLAIVFGSDGMLLAAQAAGSRGTPTDVAVAMSEIRTVLSTGNSTRRQRQIMEEEGSQRGDYADRIGSLLGGGVPIYDKPASEEEREFVGAVAFSGGTPEQNEQICVEAVLAAGLYTDI